MLGQLLAVLGTVITFRDKLLVLAGQLIIVRDRISVLGTVDPC